MLHPSSVGLMASVLLAAPAALRPQQPVTVKEERPGLLARATLPADSASKLALSRVPGGVIAGAEIEVEHGRLLYSFDIRRSGHPGIEEVQVDARTGKVLGVEHEDAAAEARERKADSARARP